jgi:catechol 2,3-dioxygenase-like lactoylglutathione lyase family enzyme
MFAIEEGATPMEWKLEVVMVPVADVDRAKHFYSEQVGFAVDLDTQMGETRFVQLTPPGSGCSIHIGTNTLGMQPGSVKGLQLVVSDVEAARAQLSEGGVAVSEIQHYEGAELLPGRGGRWNSFIFFSDPDGNSWTVQERPSSE